MPDIVYLSVQNGCILDAHSSFEEAQDRCQEEIKKDFLSIVFKRSMRKLFAKSGNVALHKYSVMTVTEVKEIK